MPAPKTLSEEQVKPFLAYVAAQAKTIRDKSVKELKTAVTFAHENGIYNEWSKKAATLLAEIEPSRFPVLSDEVVNTQYSTAPTFSTKPIANSSKKLMRSPPSGNKAQ